MSRNFCALILIHGGMVSRAGINTLFPFKAASPFLPFKQDEWLGRRRVSVFYIHIYILSRAVPPKILPPSGWRKLLQRKQWSGGARRMLSHFPCPFITNTRWLVDRAAREKY